MKPEDKILKQGVELNEDELDGVAGGFQSPDMRADVAQRHNAGIGADNLHINNGRVVGHIVNPSNKENMFRS